MFCCICALLYRELTYGVLVSVILCPRCECEDLGHLDLFIIGRHSCVILGTFAWPQEQVSHGRASHFPARAQAHMLAARVPPPTLQPRWSLPGQLSCLPHGSVAPRTGPRENPAGQGASKPGSSWDARGYWGWVSRSFRGDLEPLCMCGAGLGLQGQEVEEDSLKQAT